MVRIFLFIGMLCVPRADSVLARLPPEIRNIFGKLQQIVTSPGEPKGYPFPTLVSKPERSHRIAVVGAGLAGLHMAYLLKKNGFKDVVVLEKETRTGGKVMSVEHKGIIHEMGACYTNPDYVTNVYALAKDLSVDDFVALPKSTVWLDDIPLPLLYKNFVIMEVKRLTKAKTDLQAVGNLIKATYRYAVLHRNMFGKYEGELMFRPSKEVLSSLNQTLFSYLKQHDLLALVPCLTAAHTMQGYGHLDTVSALYGMLWDTPNFVYAMLARSLGAGQGGIDMFRGGFMQLTNELTKLVDVRLNTRIKNIKRDSTGITIHFNDGVEKTEKYDFLIWAADTREVLKVLENPTPQEREFSNLKNTWFSTTLFDSTEQCKSFTPIDYWLSNLHLKREHSVWARRNAKYIMSGTNCPTTSGVETRISTVSYQMGDSVPLGSSVLKNNFNQHFTNRLGLKNITIVRAESWNYFPRYSVQEMADGILWDIQENQGIRNTWFIGSSVSFESTKSVMEYNHLMMRRLFIN